DAAHPMAHASDTIAPASPATVSSATPAAGLRRRLDPDTLRRRLAREGRQEARADGTGGDLMDPEHLGKIGRVLHWGLLATGLRERGRRNALDFRVPRNEVMLPSLPAAFDGFRLLHLSDLHADTGSRFAHALGEAVAGVACD